MSHDPFYPTDTKEVDRLLSMEIDKAIIKAQQEHMTLSQDTIHTLLNTKSVMEGENKIRRRASRVSSTSTASTSNSSTPDRSPNRSPYHSPYCSAQISSCPICHKASTYHTMVSIPNLSVYIFDKNC